MPRLRPERPPSCRLPPGKRTRGDVQSPPANQRAGSPRTSPATSVRLSAGFSVEGDVDGFHSVCLVDTGSSITVISDVLADKVGKPLVPTNLYAETVSGKHLPLRGTVQVNIAINDFVGEMSVYICFW